MTARFTVESWGPEFGAPFDVDPEEEADAAKVDAGVELAAPEWRPVGPSGARSATVGFVDGVRRIDARLWVEEEGGVRLAICASLAAGAVVCDGAARVVSAQLARVAVGPHSLGSIETRAGTFAAVASVGATLSDLVNRLQVTLQELEVEATRSLEALPLLVVDGSLTGRETVPNIVGYLKSHQAPYLEGELARVVARLKPGERTPVFLVETTWSRYSWYLRLPGGRGHPWAGIVRCEASAARPAAEAIRLAGLAASTLPAFASEEHKDPRAPQNLYPVAGLERELKRRLGDAALVYRGLLVASQTPVGVA